MYVSPIRETNSNSNNNKYSKFALNDPQIDVEKIKCKLCY